MPCFPEADVIMPHWFGEKKKETVLERVEDAIKDDYNVIKKDLVAIEHKLTTLPSHSLLNSSPPQHLPKKAKL
jgi:hypothetical protein